MIGARNRHVQTVDAILEDVHPWSDKTAPDRATDRVAEARTAKAARQRATAMETQVAKVAIHPTKAAPTRTLADIPSATARVSAEVVNRAKGDATGHQRDRL